MCPNITMMRWLTIALVLLAGSLQAADGKVAFVEVPRLLSEPPQVAKVRDALRVEFAERDERLIEQQLQVKQLEEKLAKEAGVMSEAESKRLERDIISRKLRLKNSRTELQQERQLRQNEEVDRLRKIISEVIAQVAQDEALDIVLEAGVTWASDRANITDKVLTRLNKLDKAGR